MQKNIRIGIILLIGGVAIVGGVYWVQKYLLRSRASTNPIATFAIAGDKKIAPGDAFDLLLQVNPNSKPFYTFDLTFTFDTLKIIPKYADSLMSNIVTASGDIQLLVNNTSFTIDTANHQAKVRVKGLRNTGNGDPFLGASPTSLVKISLNMKADAALPVEFKWDTTSTTDQNLDIENLIYTGLDPTAIPGVIGSPPVAVPTITPHPTASSSLTPAPTSIIVIDPDSMRGGAGVEGITTKINPRQDTLYINSIASYPAPFRYEQPLKLEKGTYTLTVGAKLYIKRGTGLVIVLQCNESSCGETAEKKALKKNDIVFKTPTFPLKTDFSELQQSFTIADAADNKELVLRIYCDDGSECDVDYVSIEDAWGSERLKNTQFAEVQQIVDPRLQPSSWEIDSTANLYGSIDPAYGNNGALMINNPAK